MESSYLNGPLLMTEEDTIDELKYRIVRHDNVTYYYNANGNLHRDEDKPAIIYSDGVLVWFCDGLLHRDNGPAVIDLDGVGTWYQHGEEVVND